MIGTLLCIFKVVIQHSIHYIYSVHYFGKMIGALHCIFKVAIQYSIYISGLDAGVAKPCPAYVQLNLFRPLPEPVRQLKTAGSTLVKRC